MLNTVSEEYNTLFSKNEFYLIQKAYTTPHFIVLCTRFPGKNVFIYVGRGGKYQGIYIHAKAPQSEIRIQDKFLDYIRKNLVGTRIGKINVHSHGNAFSFSFKRISENNELLFGYRSNGLFFVKKEDLELYTSWNNEKRVLIDNNLQLINLDIEISRKEKSEGLKTISEYIDEEKNKFKGIPQIKKREKFLLKKIENIKSDLLRVKNWISLEKWLLTCIESDLIHHEIILFDFKFKFEGQHNFWQKRDLIFNKIKKLKKSESLLRSRLVETSDELDRVKSGEMGVSITKEKAISILWGNEVKSSKENPAINIKFFLLGKIEGIMGLDSDANDWIRQQSSKEFLWFHIHGYTGCHCILKTDDFSQFSMVQLNCLASLIRDFSKLNIHDIPIVHSQLRHVKGLKGRKGAVLIKKPRYLNCPYVNWIEIITLH